jgi:hypothetical protein
MISKLIYSTFLFIFIYSFAATTQLPRLIYQNFIAPAAAQQQPATIEANNQQKIKRATTAPASPQKTNILPPAQVSTPKPTTSQTPAQLGFLFVVGLLNLFLGFKITRWTYRTFIKTPLFLIVAAVKFLIVKPYKFFTTPKVLERYEFSYAVSSSNERSIIVR